MYKVPFFIWTNYDIDEQDNIICGTGYLNLLTHKIAGLPMTEFMQFQEELYNELPAIGNYGIIDNNYDFKFENELTERQAKLLWEYSILNYCGVHDMFDEARKYYEIQIEQ